MTDAMSTIVAVSSIAVAVPAVRELWLRWIAPFRDRVRVYKLHHSDARSAYSIGLLHDGLFNDNVSEPFSKILDWIKETDLNLNNGKLFDIVIFAKKRKLIIGYMYFQYYRDSKLVFISYIGINKNVQASPRNGITSIIAYAIQHTIKSHFNWRCVVAEIEEYRFSSSNNLYAPHAPYVLRTFNLALFIVNNKLKTNYRAYQLLIDYDQPSLTSGGIDDYERLDQKDRKQRLVIIPKDESEIIKKSGRLFISKEFASDIINNLFDRDYADSYPGDERYGSYLEKKKNMVLSGIDQLVEITADPKIVSIT